jgi:hypothetical protein
MATQATRIYDRFRRPLFPGVQVELHAALPLVLTIVDIRPIIDPRQPAGLHQIDLTVTLPLIVQNSTPIDILTAVSYPKAQEIEAKKPAPAQDTDAPAGDVEYFPPEGKPS